jgi:arylsulfatase A
MPSGGKAMPLTRRALFLVIALLAGGEIVAAETRPNIVLIMADDVGIEGFSCYGSQSYKTPHVDALAAAGVRFANCHAQPLCTPTRMKLMTGRSNGRNYVRFSIMPPGTTTFAHLLKRAGYTTAVAGKWQLYGAKHYGKLAGKGIHPTKAGFDEYCLWQIDRLGSRYWDPLVDRNGTILKNTAGKYGPDLFAEFITDFFKRHRDKPFFLYYPMALVHSPFPPTPTNDNGNRRNRPRKNFPAMVSYMDGIVGRIVKSLRDLKLDKNTLVIFTGDNGTHKSITSRMNGRTIRGGKGKTTDAGTHVPLVVAWPGKTPRGTVCRDLVDFTDFFPTVMEAAGATIPKDYKLDGRSFLPQALGRKGNPRDWIYCYYNPRPERTKPVRFARDVRWKLYGDGRLFDLSKDVDETTPLTAGGKTVASRVARKKLQAALDSMPHNPPLGLRR